MDEAHGSEDASTEPQINSRKSYKTGREQRQKIMDAAVILFGCKGFMGTSMREIAKASDISQPGLLHHFATKDDLLKAILEKHEEKNQIDLQGYSRLPWQEASISKQRSNLAKKDIIKLWSLALAEAATPTHPMHEYYVERYRNFRQLMAVQLAAAEGREYPTSEDFLKSAVLIGASDGLQTQWLLDDNFDMTPSFDYLIAMISRYSQYRND